MSYYDIGIKDTSCDNAGVYSVVVEASDKNEAIQIMTDNRLYLDAEDLDSIEYVDEISEKEFEEHLTIVMNLIKKRKAMLETCGVVEDENGDFVWKNGTKGTS